VVAWIIVLTCMPWERRYFVCSAVDLRWPLLRTSHLWKNCDCWRITSRRTLTPCAPARNPQDRPASAAHVAERLAEFTQSADLVGLLGRAREAESQSPLPERGPEQRLRQFGLNTANDIANDGNGNGNRVGRWIAAAFALPILIVAEILIRLETDKGQLVIESEVSDIEVHIVGDAKPAGEISIKQGATATRLRAGKYELIINGKSDELTIDNRQFPA